VACEYDVATSVFTVSPGHFATGAADLASQLRVNCTVQCSQAEAIRAPVTSRPPNHRKIVFLSAMQEMFLKCSKHNSQFCYTPTIEHPI
jgi:hypothetical protein